MTTANRMLQGLLIFCGASWLAAQVQAGATTGFRGGGGGGAGASGGDITSLLKLGGRVDFPPGDSFSSLEARLELAGGRVDAAGSNTERESSRFWGRIGMPRGSSGVRAPSEPLLPAVRASM